MKRLVLAGLAAVASLAVAGATAQDFSLQPSFGTYGLDAGFMPDPQSISVTAGGDIDAARLGSPCSGSIANAPDVRINYSAGGFPLRMYVRSGTDTTLVVNAPDGLWYCDDDSAGGLDPQVYFSNPQSGQYDIWVGQFSGGMGASTTLYVSEQ